MNVGIEDEIEGKANSIAVIKSTLKGISTNY